MFECWCCADLLLMRLRALSKRRYGSNRTRRRVVPPPDGGEIARVLERRSVHRRSQRDVNRS
eukprot:6206334-Pleurochrysis_carterae.AAC.1